MISNGYRMLHFAEFSFADSHFAESTFAENPCYLLYFSKKVMPMRNYLHNNDSS